MYDKWWLLLDIMPMSYLWQPVIPSQVIQQKVEEPQTAVFALIGDHQCGVLMVDAE